MFVTFDLTFLLWVVYFAVIIPQITTTSYGNNLTVSNIAVICGAFLGITPQAVIMFIHYRNFKTNSFEATQDNDADKSRLTDLMRPTLLHEDETSEDTELRNSLNQDELRWSDSKGTRVNNSNNYQPEN